MEDYATEQEAFWAGEFGDDYVDRNMSRQAVANRVSLFAKILERTRDVRSVLELGANVGQNLVALSTLLPECAFTAVEINTKAIERLETIERTTVIAGSLLEQSPDAIGVHDLAMTCGVLIHLAPSRLEEAYRRLYECSSRYVLVNEYYNPTPVEVPYRGHESRLFKRDFAGELLERYDRLRLVDYGFQYHRDPNFPADDMTWFLLEKSS